MKAIAISKQGSRSEANEDACLVLAAKGVFVVADGVGGGPAGEIASRCVVDSLSELLRQTDAVSDQSIELALQAANQRIVERANSPDFRGMASTVALAWVNEDSVRCYHVGDSRIYRMRDNNIEQLTRDHTKVVKRANGSEKVVVTQAMGARTAIIPDVTVHNWLAQDVLLLMSDGISDLLSDREIMQLMSKNGTTMADRAHYLINQSEELGGTDDKTIVIVFN